MTAEVCAPPRWVMVISGPFWPGTRQLQWLSLVQEYATQACPIPDPQLTWSVRNADTGRPELTCEAA